MKRCSSTGLEGSRVHNCYSVKLAAEQLSSHPHPTHPARLGGLLEPHLRLEDDGPLSQVQILRNRDEKSFRSFFSFSFFPTFESILSPFLLALLFSSLQFPSPPLPAILRFQPTLSMRITPSLSILYINETLSRFETGSIRIHERPNVTD